MTEEQLIRAAILDVIDDGWQCGNGCDLKHPWQFPTEMFPGDREPDDSDIKQRLEFCDTVVARIQQLRQMNKGETNDK